MFFGGTDGTAIERTPRRLLFVATHFYEYDQRSDLASRRDNREERAAAVMRSVASLHETFGPALRIPTVDRLAVTPPNTVDVILVTTRGKHLLDELGATRALFRHVEVDVEPVELGFANHRVLAEHAGGYDYYCYVEDDIVINDPLFFDKLAWFTATFGDDVLLQPNRFEVGSGCKVYIDPPLPPDATARIRQPDGPDQLVGNWLGVAAPFEHPSNPHAAAFFVNAAQFDRLRAWPGFGKASADFIRTLESAATLSVASVFRIYKPAPPSADLLEVQHHGTRYLSEWIAEQSHAATAARLAVEARLRDAEARLRDAETELAEIRASTSWRITAPGRAIGAALRR
jgi:hypothetical protein